MTTSNSPGEQRNVSPDRLEQEAFAWLGKLTDGEVPRSTFQAFQRWLALSPAHAAAFDKAKRQWQAMQPALAALLQADPAKAARHQRLMRGDGDPQWRRRAFLGAAAGAAAMAGIAVVGPPIGMWLSPAQWQADFRTATGEQRTVALSNRSSITLNTQTSIRRQGTRDDPASGIELISGEAAIDLARGGRFTVAAGAGRCSAEAGRFEVRYLGEEVRVTCLEGSVRVEHAAGNRLLQASQRTVYNPASVSGIAAVDPVDVAAWRNGELVFHQTPLAQVVEEINRYRPGRVVLLATQARNLLVEGRFRIAVLDEALLQLQHAFHLNARLLPAGVMLLS